MMWHFYAWICFGLTLVLDGNFYFLGNVRETLRQNLRFTELCRLVNNEQKI